MGQVFFSDWAMWEKLVFVRISIHSAVSPRHVGLILVQCLACAIVVTVLLGCSKLVYTRWRLRKFIQIAEQETREQTMQKEMVHQHKLAQASDKADAFGVRAIEQGIEVEGVWISRSNTPELTSRNNSTSSSFQDRAPRKDFGIDLERQEVRMARGRSLSNSTIGTARTCDRAVSADRGVDGQPSRDQSPEAAIAKPARARHPPSSYVRYSCNPYIMRQSAFEGIEAIHKASTSIHSQEGDRSTSDSDNSNISSHSGNDIEAITASGPSFFTAPPVQPRARQRQKTSIDLDLLNKHRTSQAAEMGQLTPRAKLKHHNLSLDIRNLPAFSRASTSDSQLDYFSSQSRSRPMSATAMSPTTTVSPSAARRLSMPDVTPFTQFCKTAPAPKSRPQSKQRDGDAVTVYETPSTSPIIPASDGAAALSLPPALALPPPKRTSFELKYEPQILRGRGSGFEILQPGSLNPKLPPRTTGSNESEEGHQKAPRGPPISLHNSTRHDSTDNRRSRLQKKRRPSPDSTSSFDSGSSNASRRSRMSLLLG